jgi:hypothetical protein
VLCCCVLVGSDSPRFWNRGIRVELNFELSISRAIVIAGWLGLTRGLAYWLRCACRCWLSMFDCAGAVGRVAGCLAISPVISHVCICVCVCAGVMHILLHSSTPPHLHPPPDCRICCCPYRTTTDVTHHRGYICCCLICSAIFLLCYVIIPVVLCV